jgi:hypothetical protein
MRRAINGLSVLVVERFEGKITSGDLYVFFNKKRDLVKILFWHVNGFVLCQKRLEKHKFVLYAQKNLAGSSVLTTINAVQLEGLLVGLDFMLMKDFKNISYTELV